MKMSRTELRLLGLAIAALISAAGCGGGGGESPGTIADDGTATATTAGRTVGTAGGQIATTSGSVAITIPSNSLSIATRIQISTATASTPPGTMGSALFALLPEGTQFASPATITVKYSDTGIASEILPDTLTLAYLRLDNGLQSRPL